jgi:hypothetical protein
MDRSVAVTGSDPILSTNSSSSPTTEEIVDAVSRAAGTTPLELPPLHDTVDAEALERVLESNPDSQLSFSYRGFRVVASGDGTVAVYPESGSK